MLNDSLSVTTLFLLLLTFLIDYVISETPPPVRTCEPIRLRMCKTIGYNFTGMPNLAGHETQDEADQSFETFDPLIKFGCSSQLNLFLCSVYTPMCVEKILPTIGPCRKLCETVRDRCLPILDTFGFPWPSYFNCSSFPAVNDHQTMCMEGPGEEESSSRKFAFFPTSSSTKNSVPTSIEVAVDTSTIHSSTEIPLVGDCQDLKFYQQYYRVRIGENESQCVHSCSADILYASSTKSFADFWIAFWSTFCVASSIFSICVFFLRTTRFFYPERAIIYMGINYFIYGCIHLVIIAVGRAKISCYEDHQYKTFLFVQNGYANTFCVIVFTLLYYTTLSSLIWWFMMTLTMFFIISQQWSSDRLESWFGFYHLLAWGLPLIATLTVLFRGDIGAEELTGICNVGNQNPDSLLFYIIIPNALILSFGLLTFVWTSISYVNQRSRKSYQTSTCLTQRHGSYQSSSEKISYNNLSSSQNSHPSQMVWLSRPKLTEELGITLVRLAVFQIIYFAISLYLLGVSVYEYFYRNIWYSRSTTDLPNVEVMSLKIFISFLAGIMTGIWVWMAEPRIPFVSRSSWKKKCPTSLIVHQHQLILPTESSLVTLDSRGRYYHRGSETTV